MCVWKLFTCECVVSYMCLNMSHIRVDMHTCTKSSSSCIYFVVAKMCIYRAHKGQMQHKILMCRTRSFVAFIRTNACFWCVNESCHERINTLEFTSFGICMCCVGVRWCDVMWAAHEWMCECVNECWFTATNLHASCACHCPFKHLWNATHTRTRTQRGLTHVCTCTHCWNRQTHAHTVHGRYITSRRSLATWFFWATGRLLTSDSRTMALQETMRMRLCA